MSIKDGRAFNEWPRAQLKARKMSQRQLAAQSGVDHSTISRLVRGDRTPSLGTAAKLALGLRELRDDGDTTQYLGLLSASNAHPTVSVERSLRADDAMSELQVRQVMQYYLAIRMRRIATREPEPIAVLELFDVRLGEPVDAAAFVYRPSTKGLVDMTDMHVKYLAPLRP